MAEASDTVMLDITGLTQNTDYTLYVLTVNADLQFMASASFKTEEDVMADALILTDGFIVNRNHECTENGKENAQKTVTTVHKNQ